MLDSLWSAPPFPFFVVVAFVTCLTWYGFSRSKRNPRGLPFPPGPKGLPLLGNALQITQGKSWETYRDWSSRFGDIIYLEALGQPIIVLNSVKVITDLLDGKASNFSDRVHTPSLDMLNFDWNFGLRDYGPYWKEHRRVFHGYFNATQIPKYHLVFEQQVRVFLQRLLTDDKDFMELAKHCVGAIITQISYGIDDAEQLSKHIDDAESIVEAFSDIALPGQFLVDVFPILRFVPSWFPGVGWKRKLQGYGKRGVEAYYGSFEEALGRFRSGRQGHSANIADDIISQIPDPTDPSYASMVEKARNATIGGYVGGVDTTTQAARALFLVLAMYPEAQRRAQQEIDTILGSRRLPKPSDIASLPYVNALVKELVRWHTIGPLAVPHRVREDDEYNGYFIPKGTIVLYNLWSMLHDPEIFSDPMEFRPERYLNGEVDSQYEFAPFGYGRRKCPGMALAQDILGFFVASLLSVFDIMHAMDSEGNPIPLKYEVGAELVSKVKPFQIAIKPRSLEHAALLSDY